MIDFLIQYQPYSVIVLILLGLFLILGSVLEWPWLMHLLRSDTRDGRGRNRNMGPRLLGIICGLLSFVVALKVLNIF